MKYSITVLQAEITRFENGIRFDKEMIIQLSDAEKPDKKHISDRETQIKEWEAQITELKADIKKL